MTKSYSPIGFCIYCGATQYDIKEPARKLGDEHIIPQGIGGTVILPDSSCRSCEVITSIIENECISRLFGSARTHLGIKSRKIKKPRTYMRMESEDGLSTRKVLKDDHPGIIMMFKFPPPNIIFGLQSMGNFAGQIVMRPVVKNFRERVIKQGNKFRFRLGGGLDAETFGRFLAKIAHAYTVAELSKGSFVPLLPPLIIGPAPYNLSQFVGSELLDEAKIGSERHEISIQQMSRLHGCPVIAVRIRLFADLNMPTHYVVSGIQA